MEYWKRTKEKLLFFITNTPILQYSITPEFVSCLGPEA